MDGLQSYIIFGPKRRKRFEPSRDAVSFFYIRQLRIFQDTRRKNQYTIIGYPWVNAIFDRDNILYAKKPDP